MKGHHNVGLPQGFREHVLDFSIRFDIPLRGTLLVFMASI